MGRAPFLALTGPAGSSVELWKEDSLRGLRARLDPGSVDVVVTSPPYNRRVPYSSYRDDRPRRSYLRWIAALGASVDSALAPRGSFFLNVGGSPSDPWIPWDVAGALRERFVLQNLFLWVKSIAIDRALVGRGHPLRHDLVVGHYKPLRSDRYVHNSFEYVFQFTRDGRVPIDRLAVGVPYSDKSNLGRWRSVGADRRCRGNVWFLPYRTIRRREADRPHPAPFPPELPERCLRLHGLARVRRVVDPFVGIGASAIAAARLGLPFVGFDLDAEYLAETGRRIARLSTED